MAKDDVVNCSVPQEEDTRPWTISAEQVYKLWIVTQTVDQPLNITKFLRSHDSMLIQSTCVLWIWRRPTIVCLNICSGRY